MELSIDAIKNDRQFRSDDYNDYNSVDGRKKRTHAFITECRRIIWEHII